MQYWGVNGFARILRGSNSQQIEAGDCWYAEPSWEMEQVGGTQGGVGADDVCDPWCDVWDGPWL